MRTCLRASPLAILCAIALVVCPAPALGAAQQAADGAPVSLDRIKEELSRRPGRQFKPEAPVPLRVPTFRSRVDQRVFVLTLEEALHKEFDLNDLQRQSAEWASKCCGLNIGQLFEAAEDALKARKIRKIQEQIWRELAELEAARVEAAKKKLPPADVK